MSANTPANRSMRIGALAVLGACLTLAAVAAPAGANTDEPPLVAAARAADADAVERLLARGVDVDQRQPDGAHRPALGRVPRRPAHRRAAARGQGRGQRRQRARGDAPLARGRERQRGP